MSRFSSYIEGPRWASAGKALEVYGMQNGIDIKTVTTKCILRERIDFTITGTDAEINQAKRWLASAVQAYNED